MKARIELSAMKAFVLSLLHCIHRIHDHGWIGIPLLLPFIISFYATSVVSSPTRLDRPSHAPAISVSVFLFVNCSHFVTRSISVNSCALHKSHYWSFSDELTLSMYRVSSLGVAACNVSIERSRPRVVETNERLDSSSPRHSHERNNTHD
jgi:hypothetical protein